MSPVCGIFSKTNIDHLSSFLAPLNLLTVPTKLPYFSLATIACQNTEYPMNWIPAIKTTLDHEYSSLAPLNILRMPLKSPGKPGSQGGAVKHKKYQGCYLQPQHPKGYKGSQGAIFKIMGTAIFLIKCTF